jgi:hypothetical protein
VERNDDLSPRDLTALATRSDRSKAAHHAIAAGHLRYRLLVASKERQFRSNQMGSLVSY